MANNNIPYPHISTEDLGKDIPQYMINYVTSANQNFQQIQNNFNAGIQEQQNIASQIVQITFTTSKNYVVGNASTFTPVPFKCSLSTTPYGVTILNTVVNNKTFTVISEPVCLNWLWNNGTIDINFVTGLQPNTSYTMTLKVQ